MIRVKNLSKEFRSKEGSLTILKNINLEIEDKEIVTIMGPSGGGKSTLLQVMALLTKRTAGTLSYDDEEITLKKEKEITEYRRKNIGLVFQNSNLISSLNVLDNIIIAMDSKASYREKKKRAKEALESLNLSKLWNKNVDSLSGGEAQRVGIIRAIINNPRFIFCDEPTGALDSENSKSVMDLLVSINKQWGSTIVIVTHESLIASYGNKRIYLKDGEINEVVRNL